MSVLIKNGRIVTAADDYQADIFINNSTIDLIGINLSVDADHVIDASGMLVIPGGLDPTPTWNFRSAEPKHPTHSRQALAPPRLAEQPALLTLSSRQKARQPSKLSTHGTPKRPVKPP